MLSIMRKKPINYLMQLEYISLQSRRILSFCSFLIK